MANRKFFPMLVMVVGAAACTGHNAGSTAANTTRPATATSISDSGDDLSLPADVAHVAARLASSPRHGEWAMIRTTRDDSVRAWVEYPQRRDRAPVVIVIHENTGLTTWARGVADQLAAAGFIAIAPDLLTMASVPRTADTVSAQDGMAAIRTLSPEAVQSQLDAVAAYGMSLPSAVKRYGIVGFCWGGGVSFTHATHAPGLGAAVVYYGATPRPQLLRTVRAPVLGLYGGSDARINSTIPSADSVLLPLGRTYVHNLYDGAGHGFLRQQSGMNGANMAAAREAWPATIAWFRKYLGS